MKRYLILSVFFIFLFSCEVKKNNSEYNIEHVNDDYHFYSVKIIGNNNNEIFETGILDDGNISRYSISDNRNFNFIVNLN